jgi:hypothetical protein
MPQFHTPTQCKRDAQQTVYVGRGWKALFRCPACGRVKWQHLNFLGSRRLVCDGIKFTTEKRGAGRRHFRDDANNNETLCGAEPAVLGFDPWRADFVHCARCKAQLARIGQSLEAFGKALYILPEGEQRIQREVVEVPAPSWSELREQIEHWQDEGGEG